MLSLLKIVCPLGFGAGLHGLGYLVLDLMHHAFLESIIEGDAVALVSVATSERCPSACLLVSPCS